METKDTQPTKHFLFKQSSELEILISAAIVFAAFKLHDLVPTFLASLINNNVSNQSIILFIVAIVALFLGALLPISILLHFILRFYWLSLLGLKTVYHKPRLEKLNYSEKYLKHIQKKIDLDKHISKVDTISSSIFAFSFLAAAIFCFTTISVLGILYCFLYLLENVFIDTWFEWVVLGLLVLFLITCILGFIDFLTLGSLKRIKNKKFVRFYFPISKFLSVITFSFFYRGLYHTLVTNVPKYVTAVALPLYLLLAIFLLNLGYYESKLFSQDKTALRMGEYAIIPSSYEDNFQPDEMLNGPFISSYYVKENSLQISYSVTEELDDSLIKHCDSVQAINERGIHWRKWNFSFNQRKLSPSFNYKKNAENVLACFSNNLKIIIDDSLYITPQFRFRKLQAPEKITLMAFLDIQHLKKGDHILKIQLQEPIGKSNHIIPFYKEVN